MMGTTITPRRLALLIRVLTLLMASTSTTAKKFYSFNHGVASGDPLSDAVIIWTRLTPEVKLPLNFPLTVLWKVARDPDFLRPVKAGLYKTTAAMDWTVKVDVTGLEPSTVYYYRFVKMGVYSPIGKTKTLPAAVQKLKFATLSCSNWVQGYFHAYQELSKIANNLDLITHLGDYIYEYPDVDYSLRQPVRRNIDNNYCVNLTQYRLRHAQYRTDPSAQKLFASVPLIAVWDDHEVADNAWKNGSAEHNEATQGPWLTRQEVATQAYFEWMPIRGMKRNDIFRTFKYGDLAEIFMLEDRRERSLQLSQAIYGAYQVQNFAEATATVYQALDAPGRTILGDVQLAKFAAALNATKSKWQIIGSPVIMARTNLPIVSIQAVSVSYVSPVELAADLASNQYLTPQDRALVGGLYALGGAPVPFFIDSWDGYRFHREQVYELLTRVPSPVVIAGDSHSSWAFNLWRINRNTSSPQYGSDDSNAKVGVEFAGPSVSSVGIDQFFVNATINQRLSLGFQVANPHLAYADVTARGYMVHEVTPGNMTTWYYRISDVRSQNYTVSCAVRASTKYGTRTLEPLQPC